MRPTKTRHNDHVASNGLGPKDNNRVASNGLGAKARVVVTHEWFRRLHHIEQLGTIAQTGQQGYSRAAHSLAVAANARLVARALRLDAHWTEVLEVAALLHDVGHGPFSHAFDEQPDVNSQHEDRSQCIVRLMGHELRWSELFIRRVQALIGGHEHPDLVRLVPCALRFVVNSPDELMDVDRLAYIPRDAALFGVPCPSQAQVRHMIAQTSRVEASGGLTDGLTTGRWVCGTPEQQRELWNVRLRLHAAHYRRSPWVRFSASLGFTRLRTRADCTRFRTCTPASLGAQFNQSEQGPLRL